MIFFQILKIFNNFYFLKIYNNGPPEQEVRFSIYIFVFQFLGFIKSFFVLFTEDTRHFPPEDQS